MCRTPHCFGDCEECEAEQKERDRIKALETCQFSNDTVLESECGLTATSIKCDSCSKCGYQFNYS